MELEFQELWSKLVEPFAILLEGAPSKDVLPFVQPSDQEDCNALGQSDPGGN